MRKESRNNKKVDILALQAVRQTFVITYFSEEEINNFYNRCDQNLAHSYFYLCLDELAMV